jgi:tripartite ATP-independent transporter DctM subunit
MDLAAVSLIIVVVLVLVFLAAGVHIGVALGIGAIVGTTIFTGNISIGFSLIHMVSVSVTTTYGFLVIPLFILLGNIASESGIAKDLFDAAVRWVGKLPGGLAVTTILTCAGMAAITGTSLGTAATMTRIALPELRRHNYSEELSVGTIALGGTLSIMIPPSITMVLYGIFAEQSIGKLLIAGILPGILNALLYILLIIGRCIFTPSLGPKGERFDWLDRWISLFKILPFIAIVLMILFGILFGVFTPVEASGVGVFLVFVLGLFRRQLGIRVFLNALAETAITSAAIMILVVGCIMFTKFLALTGFNETITNLIVTFDLRDFSLFLVIIALYLFLGMFMEATSILALTIPLLIPVIIRAGWDPIWFGVIAVGMMEVASVTPPVGLNLYVVKSAAPEVPMKTIYIASIPFWLCDITGILIIYFVPQIALILPGLM